MSAAAQRHGNPGPSTVRQALRRNAPLYAVKQEVKNEEDEYAMQVDSMDVEELLDVPSTGHSTPQSYKYEYDSDIEILDRKSTRLNSSHSGESRMPSSA